MEENLKFILNRIDSNHLARLWLFYQEFFKTDDECLDFIYSVLEKEPEKSNDIFTDRDESLEKLFIPRRMINTIMRLISAAIDMDLIRKNKDVFKIIYIITCIETLQKFKDPFGKQGTQVRSFFEEYISPTEKDIIKAKFTISNVDVRLKPGEKTNLDKISIKIKEFGAVIYEYRNCATHTGEYWESIFQDYCSDTPILRMVKIDTQNYSPSPDKKITHYYEVSLKYVEFEEIIVRACINFVKKYIEHIDN